MEEKGETRGKGNDWGGTVVLGTRRKKGGGDQSEWGEEGDIGMFGGEGRTKNDRVFFYRSSITMRGGQEKGPGEDEQRWQWKKPKNGREWDEKRKNKLIDCLPLANREQIGSQEKEEKRKKIPNAVGVSKIPGGVPNRYRRGNLTRIFIYRICRKETGIGRGGPFIHRAASGALVTKRGGDMSKRNDAWLHHKEFKLTDKEWGGDKTPTPPYLKV